MPFKELEHTADIKMLITARDFCELFEESGSALSTALYGDYVREMPTMSVELEAFGATPEEAIVNYLSELLFQMEVEYLVPMEYSLNVESTQDNISISGRVFGVEFDRAKHSGGIGVKGISYSGLTLTKSEEGFELQIIFDI